jgi:hypothetical protein
MTVSKPPCKRRGPPHGYEPIVVFNSAWNLV